MKIDTVRLCDWIDNKFSQTKNSTYDFREKLAVYNTLIELQEFMKADLNRQIEEQKEAVNVEPPEQATSSAPSSIKYREATTWS